MRPTVLVTGCSSGIGRATAERFRDAGWEVYATARDAREIRDLDGPGCRTAALDVTDRADVARVVDMVFGERGRLDCLVNNAGYGQVGPIEDVPMKRVERQFDVNTFGPIRLVKAILPRMRAQARGTIVNVGGGMANLTLPGLGVYVGSKYALHSMTDALRQEVSGSGVDVALVEPGIVATDFYERAVDELSLLDRSAAYDDLYRVLDDVSVVARGGPGINSPGDVADVIVEAASADRPRPVYRVGPTAYAGSLFGSLVRGRARDAVMRGGLGALASGPAQRVLERRKRDVRPRIRE